MVKRRFLCSLLCCSPCCVVLALVGANNRFVGANAMFATFAPRILWFAQRNLWLAPRNAGFAMGILSKTHQSSLTLKGGSTSHLGLLPSGKKRKPLLLVARNHFILWLADHQRSRQQQSCGLRYATAWTRIAYELQIGQEAHSSTP